MIIDRDLIHKNTDNIIDNISNADIWKTVIIYIWNEYLCTKQDKSGRLLKGLLVKSA